MTQGLLLFAHGARDPTWAEPFRRIAAQASLQRPELVVELAFLEFLSPDLPTAAAALAAKGCTSVRIVPVFLGTGGHVRRDLPLLMQQLRERHPGVSWSLRAAVGEHAEVISAMARVACEDLP